MKEKEIIIMIHGFTSNKNQFRKLNKELENEKREIILVQLDSHENGEDNQGFQIKKTIREVQKILEERKTSKKTIIGESIGAIIALRMASQYEVDKLILLSTPLNGVEKDSIEKRLKEKNEILKSFKKDIMTIKMDEIERIKKEFDEETNGVKGWIKRLETECVVLYGMKDEKSYEESAKYINKNINTKHKKMFAFEKSGHSLILGEEKEEVMKIIKNEIESRGKDV